MLRTLVTSCPLLRLLALLLGGLLASTAPVLAEESAAPKHVDRAQSWGPAVAIGTGSQTVVVGGQLLYYFQLPSVRWRMALHLGAGGFPIADEAGPHWGMNGGTFFGFGRHHRLVFGLEAGTLGWSTFFLHGEALDLRQVPGIGASVGWEWMSSFGLFTRGSIGPAIVVDRASPLKDREILPWLVGGWVLGYKPW